MTATNQQNDGSPDTANLYAWLSREDESGAEGIVAAEMGGQIFPLVFSDKSRADRFAGDARRAAAARGAQAHLVVFHRGDTIRTVG